MARDRIARDVAAMAAAIGPEDGKRHWIDWGGNERGDRFREDYLGDLRRWLGIERRTGGERSDIEVFRDEVRRVVEEDPITVAISWKWDGKVLNLWTYGWG